MSIDHLGRVVHVATIIMLMAGIVGSLAAVVVYQAGQRKAVLEDRYNQRLTPDIISKLRKLLEGVPPGKLEIDLPVLGAGGPFAKRTPHTVDWPRMGRRSSVGVVLP
jgi:hypothetical protein